MPAPKTYHLSASSIASFKACPTRFRLAYREGLRPDKDTDAQRMGTNWHGLHEEYYRALQSGDADAALQAVVAFLNDRYKLRPGWKTAEEWEHERQVLYISFIGYLWYYQNDPIEVLASEIPFKLPLKSPKVGLNLPVEEVVRVGKIDHVIKWQGMVGTVERKSTSRAIGADSDYWDRAQKDTQVSMYALAMRDLQKGGTLPADLAEDRRYTEATSFGNTLYDVWHKPTIKPAMLSQKDTAAFIESGDYCGQSFIVKKWASGTIAEGDGEHVAVSVNEVRAEVEQGKKGFAIRETIEMFGARLLADIYERPDFYYVRREIARTDGDLRKFEKQLFAVYQMQKLSETQDAWIEDETQCRATFTCAYVGVCYGKGADAVCASGETPDGMKRIFVDLTVEGASVAAD